MKKRIKTLLTALIAAFLIFTVFPVSACADDDHLSEEDHTAETLQAGSGKSAVDAIETLMKED